MEQSLRDCLKIAVANRIAIAHFNIADLSGLKGIAASVRELGVPVMIGTSEGEREFIGLRNAVSLIRNLREEYGMQVFLNADHTHTFEKAKEAIDAGYDEILFDGGKLPWDENVAVTKQVIEYARASGRDIIIEGELGYIGSASEVRKEIPEGAAIDAADLTTPEQAAEFVRLTGVDLLAPAVGNIHGMFADAKDPALDIPRIVEIAKAAGVPLVLHGASGNTDEDIKAAIKAGVAVVHVSTELRVAWRRGITASLADHPDEVAPYKLLTGAAAAMADVAKNKLKLINGLI
jgi:fructose-bisphosphate aldolase, class II